MIEVRTAKHDKVVKTRLSSVALVVSWGPFLESPDN